MTLSRRSGKLVSMDQASSETKATRHAGGCHCGAIRFEVEVDLTRGVGRCNCTLCTKRSAAGVIATPSAFLLLSGDAELREYAWGAKTSRFFFCSRCGMHPFGRGNLPQLGGEYVSVNVNCLDDVDPATLKVIYWDGRHENWAAGPRDEPWPIGAAPAA
jgi:hypothetical protein